MGDVDWRAVQTGTISALVFTIPLVVLGGILDWAWIGVVVWVLWIFAGYVAASRAPELPYTHGVLAGLVTYAVTQVVGILFRVARGDDLHPTLYVFNGFLAAGLGLVGGMVAERRQ